MLLQWIGERAAAEGLQPGPAVNKEAGAGDGLEPHLAKFESRPPPAFSLDEDLADCRMLDELTEE